MKGRFEQARSRGCGGMLELNRNDMLKESAEDGVVVRIFRMGEE